MKILGPTVLGHLPLKLSNADAGSTCEHQSNQAGEAVLVLRSNLRAGEHLLRNLSLYT